MPFEKLHDVQNHAIREAVAMQERLGLPIVTDGEFRRGGWSRGFLNAVDGFEFPRLETTFRNDQGVAAPRRRRRSRRSRSARKQPIVTERFQVPASRSRRTASR